MILNCVYKIYGKDLKPMSNETKLKQVIVRFDGSSYDKIGEYAEKEHRNRSEFVRHVVLSHIEFLEKKKETNQ